MGYMIKQKFTAYDLAVGNLIYDADHDAMMKVAYIGKTIKVTGSNKNRVDCMQFILEDTKNGMIVKLDVIGNDGKLPMGRDGKPQYRHLIVIEENSTYIYNDGYGKISSKPYWGTTTPLYRTATWSSDNTISNNINVIDKARTGDVDNSDGIYNVPAISSTTLESTNVSGNVQNTLLGPDVSSFHINSGIDSGVTGVTLTTSKAELKEGFNPDSEIFYSK